MVPVGADRRPFSRLRPPVKYVGTVSGRETAVSPQDLPRLLVERVNAGDLEGIIDLYEMGAVLALPGGGIAVGRDAIRTFYGELLATRPTFMAGAQLPALESGGLALTSTRLVGGGVTAEIARRQQDGTWLWVVDRPDVLE